MASPDDVVSHTAFNALQIGLPSSSWLGFCVFGTPITSRSKASLWGSRFFYFMKSPRHRPVINKQKIMLRQYDHLQSLSNTNLELPDVVGPVHSVQGSDLEDAGVMTRVVVRFMTAPSVVVYLSLWDEAAGMFRGIIASSDKTKTVMTVNPKLFGGNLYFNSTPGTKFYFTQNTILKHVNQLMTGGVIEELPECLTELAGKEYVF
ncbi:unnamed protein product [Eruca vesicaria subsp. sativa]|uniref:Uncharacterized protein n=1 Tax=Eruca vesicaria subsp. sativa TaxID=29727 RepID=A0ABC8L7N8_ERUVS|nr:unnamed protein product [Eruca vesicaria subsp. sativa]